MSEELRVGLVVEILGEKWLVLRVAGNRAEIKRMVPGEKVTPKLPRKERRKIWAEVRRKAKKEGVKDGRSD